MVTGPGSTIREKRDDLSKALVEREFSRHPDLIERYGETARQKSLDDAGYHFAFLSQALALESPRLFADYVAWAKVMLAERKVRPSDLAFHLECMAEVVEETLQGTEGTIAAAYVREAVAAMPSMPDTLPTFLADGEPLSPLAHQYLEALLRGERHLASRLVLDAVESGTSVRDMYLHVFQATQYEIGRLWQTNRISVAEEHYCTAATQLIMSQLYPQVFRGEKTRGTLVATCVAGDLHELGVRMVADFFEMDGWDTFYLGANTPHSSVVQTLVERRASVLAISATIPFHVESVRELVHSVREAPACEGMKILVGGYPFNVNDELWRDVGADGSARDALRAIDVANRMTGFSV